MQEKLDVQEAIKDAVKTEKAAMDFYKFAAEKMDDGKAKSTFELLAREERQHAKMFYNVYKGKNLPYFEDFINSPPDTESTWWVALKEASLADFDERRALELAIEQEEALEKKLLETVAHIDDPQVRAIYQANVNSTHHHAQLIQEQYRAMLGMSL
jgi:rubrerythrin